MLDNDFSPAYSVFMKMDGLHVPKGRHSQCGVYYRLGIVLVYDREIHLWHALEA